MINILIITHGRFGTEILKTATEIMGQTKDAGAIDAIPPTNIEDLRTRIRKAIEEFASPGETLILVDTPGGTPCNACLSLKNELKIKFVTGVNLPMALSALANAGRMPLEQLAIKVAEDARKTIFNEYPVNNLSPRRS